MPNSALRQHINASEAQVEAFLLKLEKFLGRSISKAVRDIKSNTISKNEIAQVLGSLRSTLINAGLEKELTKMRGIYANELAFLNAELLKVDKKIVFADTDLAAVEALVKFDSSKVSNRIETYIGDAQSVLMRSALAGEVPNFDVYRDDAGDRLVSNLQTEMNTSLAAFNRTVTTGKAIDAGFELFEYIGPENDDVIRPFCEAVMAGEAPGVDARDVPIYTVEEINSMDNGQTSSVMVDGGGYNCRHQWRPISAEDAAAAGYGD